MAQGVSRNNFFLSQVREHATLERHVPSGIARVVDRSTGTAASCHPNISTGGSVSGMKARGYWQRTDRIVRANGFYYNTSSLVLSGEDDRIAALACQCGGECAAYRLRIGFGAIEGNTRDGDRAVAFAPRIPEIEQAQCEARRAEEDLEIQLETIPVENAEDVISVQLGVIVYIDPEGLPPVGSQERKEILAEHVIDFIVNSIDKSHIELANYIDGEELIERRNIGLTSPQA